MWTMLGARGVDALAWESFGKGWVTDTTKQLKLKDLRVHRGRVRQAARSRQGRFRAATCCSPGTAPPRACACPTATGSRPSAAGSPSSTPPRPIFAQPIDWAKVDVLTFSWQKVLGGEAAHGMLILSPRAIERLESYTPPWPLPKIFRLTKGGKLMKEVFEGETINTPSMLCVEDYLDALGWAESIGGLQALLARADANAARAATTGPSARRGSRTSPSIRRRAPTPRCASRSSIPPSPGCRSMRSAPSSSSSRRCSTRRMPPATSPATAMRRRPCASGAARRWRRPISAALTPWLDWAFAEAKAGTRQGGVSRCHPGQPAQGRASGTPRAWTHPPRPLRVKGEG